MEPKWLTERRKEAAQNFARLPLPAHEEFWRKTDLARLPMENLAPLPPAQNGAQEGAASRLLPAKVLLSGEMLYGEKISPATLDKDLIGKGVLLLPLQQAVEKHGSLLEHYLGRGFKNRNEKFLAQNEAFWQTGAFLYIPQNTTVELPLLLTAHFDSAGKSAFPRLLVVLDKGAKATLLHYATSAPEPESRFLNGVMEIYLEENAELTWVDLQSLSYESFEIAQKRVELSRNAKLKWVMDIQGGRFSKTDIETVLAGVGSSAEVMGLVCGNKKQQLELCSLTRHIAPHTTADILVKGTAQEKAKTIFQGMIRIEKTAQQTESYMANNNLVLSETAHADSIPRLEIEADDVKASHGATIGQVDAEQLFYLRTRGMQPEAAEQLLVQGFYEDIFGRIPVEAIRELMRKNMETKQ